jgi:hypothetical protein
VPLFFSRRLEKLNRLPRARGPYAIDSGEFTELSKYGERSITVDRYIAEVRRCSDCIGVPVFAAQMDHMCEPFILEKTPRVVGVAYFGPQHRMQFRSRSCALKSHRLAYPRGGVLAQVCGHQVDDAGRFAHRLRRSLRGQRRAELGREALEKWPNSCRISKAWKSCKTRKGRIFRDICPPRSLNGVQEVGGSNPLAPTSQGQLGQQVPTGLFRILGTRSDPRGRVAGRDLTFLDYPTPFLASLMLGCCHLHAVPPSGIHPKVVRASRTHFRGSDKTGCLPRFPRLPRGFVRAC